MVKITPRTDYAWAVNKLKLQMAIMALQKRAELDKSIVIDEAAVKQEYIDRAGLVIDEETSNDISDLNLRQLKKLAAEQGIDITDAETKEEVVAAIQEAKKGSDN